MKLTAKQESFSVKFVSCGDASEAYRYAYDAANMKPHTINVKACELLKSGKVSARVAELREIAKESIEKEFKYTVEWRLAKLEEVIQAGLSTYEDQQGNKRREALSASKGAIDTMNSMLGVDKDSEEGEVLTINFNVSEPVKAVKVTRGE